MKKVWVILVAVIGLGISVNAQDAILKKDGSEIKAKVLEITDQQVKYKDFDFQNGPIRNINISEVFMITYENGQPKIKFGLYWKWYWNFFKILIQNKKKVGSAYYIKKDAIFAR